jgi:hypothetical protein
MNENKRNPSISFWLAVVLTAVISPLALCIVATTSVNVGLIFICLPILHYAIAASIYGILVERESVFRSYLTGFVSFMLAAMMLSIFSDIGSFLVPLGLTLFAAEGILGTSIGVLVATVIKGNKVQKLP